jgi:vacuolar-type H+-ATPase subunit I/STV1
MLKHLMNGGSLLSYAVFDAESEAKAARDTLRAELLKNNTVVAEKEGEEKEEEKEIDEEKEEEKEDEDLEDEEKKVEEELTPEQIKEKEALEKAAAKARRKDDRMQRRIDEAIAAKTAAEEELKRFKDANPDSKLTEEEVEARANAIAEKKLRDRELANLQSDFDKTCATLQKAAIKLDPKFDDNIADIADQFGAIPSFMIGVISDFDNGAEVLVAIANDDELAEKIYGFKNSPAKMTRELVELSTKLANAKKPARRQISKVPDPITPVNPRNNNGSTVITEADTKDMDTYVRKRQAQMLERRKAGR